MSRGLSAANLTQIGSAHLQEVVLVKLAFDAPLFVHSGAGNIEFGGDTYLGVGDFGTVESVSESEKIEPSVIRLQLSGIDANLISEALDAGNYGDIVTVYEGYRKDDGELVDDPWLLGRGEYEFAAIVLGDVNAISISVQHDLVRLAEKAGDRFTNEDQQDKFAGDTGLSFLADMVNLRLLWGNKVVGGAGGGLPGGDINAEIRDFLAEFEDTL